MRCVKALSGPASCSWTDSGYHQAVIFTTEAKLLQLWRHEVTRVLADRFVSQCDKDWFNTEIVSMVKKELGGSYDGMVEKPRFFVDFMRDAPEPTGEEDHETDVDLPRVYEPLDDTSVLTDKLRGFLDQYNDLLRGANMDLVFFPDAIENIIKISRILRNPSKDCRLRSCMYLLHKSFPPPQAAMPCWSELVALESSLSRKCPPS